MSSVDVMQSSSAGAAPEAVPRLRDFCQKIVSSDDRIRRAIERDALDETTILDEAERIIQEGSFDFDARLADLDAAERTRSEALASSAYPWYGWLGLVFALVGLAGLIVLLVVSILKWLGDLVTLPIWPFVAGSTVLIFVGFLLVRVPVSRRDRRTPFGAELWATSQAELLRSTLNDQLRSLAVIPALERSASPEFLDPTDDQVSITDAPYLSSRVEAGGRIQTASYRDVLTNISRSGGATIGLAGTRGVGKSELLRTFCEDPRNAASIEAGGTIGIIVPAPVAYDSISFLRVLVRRLAEKVPGYDPRGLERRLRKPSTVDIAALVFSVAIIIIGIGFVLGLTKADRSAFGWVLVGVGALVLGIVGLFRFLLPSPIGPHAFDLFLSFFGLRDASLSASSGKVGLSLGGLTMSLGTPTDQESQATHINRERRRVLADEASGLARRIRYVETQSESREASATFKGAGFKDTSNMSIEQIPFTEADLVLELSTFIAHLHAGGYQVRIGIDELDKLVVGQKAEEFLTGIKVLFPIRDCSFILTISETSAQFARRGTPIRDVFDSSLDTVVSVQPLSFLEARRMVRSRLRPGPSEKMSDSQVLLCQCLSGGLPRDFLRYCRQLGEVNARMGSQSHNRLDRVSSELLARELGARLDGVRSSLQGRDEGDAGAVLVAELEFIEAHSRQGGL
jgi:hypothetical protein